MPSFLCDINFLDDVYPVFLLFGIYFHRKQNRMKMFKRYDISGRFYALPYRKDSNYEENIFYHHAFWSFLPEWV